MQYPPLPPDEEERLASLRRYAILDTPPEEAFDRLAELAAHLFEVPVALVSFVDESRQWFKSCRGLCGGSFPAETAREVSFCAYTILSKDVLVVEDARRDGRFADNPLVTGAPGLRFYAGAPLIGADGQALGALCLLDFEPRPFPPARQAALRDLAASVVSEMELRLTAEAAAEQGRLYRQMFADNPQPMWVYDAETLRFLDVNGAALARYGYGRDEFLALTLFDIRLPEDRPLVAAHLEELAATGLNSGNRGVWRHQTKSGETLWAELAAHSVQYQGRNARMIIATDVTERRLAEEALRRSQQHLSLHVRLAPLAVMEMTPDGVLTAWNPGAEAMFGYAASEAIGRNVLTLIVPEEVRAQVQQIGWQMLLKNAGTRTTNHNLTKSGARILCDWDNTPLVDDDGQVIGIAGMARDVTEERQANADLRWSEARKAAILESAQDCIISIDCGGRIIDWNPAAERAFGWPRAEAVGNLVTDLILPPPLRDSYQNGLIHYLKTSEWPAFYRRVELPVQRRDGAPFHAELTAAALTAEGRTLYTIYLRAISERKALEAEREALLAQTETLLADALERADRDPLTGLLNHRAFHKRLKEEADDARNSGRTVSVLLLDLDNFKFFNDAYGHAVGDDVLRRVSAVLQTACRAGDTLARFGGDEFALLMPDVGSDTTADAVRARLTAGLGDIRYTPPGSGSAVPVGLSVGVALFPAEAQTRLAVVQIADERLLRAKTGAGTDAEAQRLRAAMRQTVPGFSMLDALVTAVDAKDRYTRRHSEDVLTHSLRLADRLGLAASDRQTVAVAALLHDVGKIGIPDQILRKPGRLTDEEFEAVRMHPDIGAAIVAAVPGLAAILDAVRHHHERWDGAGYPGGLAGEAIPRVARLLAVADAYSAMTTDRPYRQGLAAAEARRLLEEGAGAQWDPACVRAFLAAQDGARADG